MENLSLKDVKGLVYPEKERVNNNGRRPLIEDLDILPFPERQDFPATLYPDFTIYSPCISLIASRGCPASCIFCMERHIMYASPKYRTRDPKSVVDEMQYCMEKFHARQFYFDDQSFTVNQKFTREVCQEIMKRDLKVPWTCMGDAMFIKRETLEIMKAAGCIGMKFGIESVNPEILKRIGKPLNPEKAKQVVKWCKELGIRTHATFCLGLPGATKESILHDMAYLDELKPFTAQVAMATPYPGTPFYQWAKENGFLVTEDLRRYDGSKEAILNYPEFPKEKLEEVYLQFLKAVSRKKFFSFFTAPKGSLSLAFEIAKAKGIKSFLRSAATVVRRAI